MEELKNEQQASKKRNIKTTTKTTVKEQEKARADWRRDKKINRTGRTKTSTRTVEIIYGASRKAA